MNADTIIVGGGIMGSATALRLAEAGQRVVLLESSLLGMGASGVNAGTLSLQIKRVGLMSYALKGHALWKRAGHAVGYHQTGGITVAFTNYEAELLTQRMTARRDAGAPIEIITAGRAREIEPALTGNLALASYCAEDGYANSSRTGTYYRRLLQQADIQVIERSAVESIEPEGHSVYVSTTTDTYRAPRCLLATGAWARALSEKIGHPLPINVRVNTVSVSERMPRIIHNVIGHASGLLTMKQSDNGTILVGGGWQGRGVPESGRGEVIPETLITNLRLAQYAVPELAKGRLVRAWTGFEAHAPDFYPLAGLLPGTTNVYVLCCVRGGYTIGPYIGQLMGDFMLDRQPELPLFDPGRFSQEPVVAHD